MMTVVFSVLYCDILEYRALCVWCTTERWCVACYCSTILRLGMRAWETSGVCKESTKPGHSWLCHELRNNKRLPRTRASTVRVAMCQHSSSNTIGRSQTQVNRRLVHRLRVVMCGLYGGLSGIVLLSAT